MWRQIFLGLSRLCREIQPALWTRCFFCSLGANGKRDKSYNSKCLHGVDPQRTKHRPLCGFCFQELCPICKKTIKNAKKPEIFCVWNQLHLSDHITVFKCDLSLRFYSMSISTLCAKKLLCGVFAVFKTQITKKRRCFIQTHKHVSTQFHSCRKMWYDLCVCLCQIAWPQTCGIILQAVSPLVFIYGAS